MNSRSKSIISSQSISVSIAIAFPGVYVCVFPLWWWINYCRAQVVGWPPVRSYRKNVIIIEKEKKKKKKTEKKEIVNYGMYVKVSLDGAPYLRKIDLKLYQSYQQLLDALEDMFNFKLG